MLYFFLLPALIQSIHCAAKVNKEQTRKPPDHMKPVNPPIVVPVDPLHPNPNPVNPHQPPNPTYRENSVTPPNYQQFTLNFPPIGVTTPVDPFRMEMTTETVDKRNRNRELHSCFSYDRRYQAETLQDALLNFPDLTLNNWRVENQNVGTQPQCFDDQCRACTNTLLQRLESIGMVRMDESENIRKNLNLGPKNSFLTTQQCPRLQLEKHLQFFFNNPETFSTNPNTEMKSIVDKLSREGNQNWINRHKRQADLSTLGHQYNVKCVKRGEPVDQQRMDYVGLCSMCWVWRQLPDDYFPQYINELVCDSDIKCLSGWGTCQQGSKNVDVLQKFESSPGNVTWRPLTLQSKMLCNCEVKAGSALHNLVNG